MKIKIINFILTLLIILGFSLLIDNSITSAENQLPNITTTSNIDKTYNQ